MRKTGVLLLGRGRGLEQLVIVRVSFASLLVRDSPWFQDEQLIALFMSPNFPCLNNSTGYGPWGGRCKKTCSPSVLFSEGLLVYAIVI